MSSGTDLQENEDQDEFAEGACDSPISHLRGMENLRVSKYYPRGSVLFMEGQQPRGIYVVCEGRVKVSIASADGRTLILRIADAGDLLGINSTMTGQPYGATVETLERCRIDFIPRDQLLRLLDRDKSGYLGLVQSLSRKVNGLIDHTRLLFVAQSASQKLALLLLKWCDQHGKRSSQGIRLRLGLTHEEIAQLICSSRETVTRAFSVLKRKHIVQAENGDLLIRNRKALIAFSKNS
ncbi:MAG TPA: Crp/Fnr family transcriptional regulator [Pyrinomonadaceae bacterium]|nr:Crp/Fnr family transcriptional regulator [Pyrinomonadaceae bacterium]